MQLGTSAAASPSFDHLRMPRLCRQTTIHDLAAPFQTCSVSDVDSIAMLLRRCICYKYSIKLPPTVGSFPPSLDMNILVGGLLASQVSLLIQTFRSQHVSAAQISPDPQSAFDEQSTSPPQAMLPSRQNPVPSSVLPQMHVLSPLQELNLPHVEPEQLAVLQTPFWQVPLAHCNKINFYCKYQDWTELPYSHIFHSSVRYSLSPHIQCQDRDRSCVPVLHKTGMERWISGRSCSLQSRCR